MTSVRYSTMETHYRIFFFDRSNFLSIYLISGSYCRRAPCQNGGSCFEISSGYICVCTEGYSGSNCEMSECYLLYCFIMKYIPFVWNLPDMTNDKIFFQCTWLYFFGSLYWNAPTLSFGIWWLYEYHWGIQLT